MNQTLKIWHEIVASKDTTRLAQIIGDDCVFYSPVVHTPQVGKPRTLMYLTSAMQVFNDSFCYVKEVVTEDYAVLEFTCTVDDIEINGVDIITFAADGRICEFKVMVRPLKGMQMLHAHMAKMLESIAAGKH
ncbi:MAG: nuclear transport factor 2 family protein [Chromatocurvus sp.]